MWPLLGVLALLVGLNALFVLIEYGLVRVRASRLELLARKGSRRAAQAQEMLAHLDQYLAAAQVGITVLALAMGAYAEPGLSGWIEARLEGTLAFLPPQVMRLLTFSAALIFLAYVQIVLGELVPRAVAIHKAEPIVLWGAWPFTAFAKLVRLPVLLMSKSSAAVLRLFGLKPAAEAETVLSEEEMRILIGETQERGTLPFERLMLIENVLDLGQTRAAEAMVPRDKIVYLSLARSWEENIELVRTRRYSRYPLCEKDLDSVVGMVHVKDLVLKPEEAGLSHDLKRLRREIAEVLEADPLEKLLKTFPDRGIHMAIVRNSLGHVTGLLTLEDIVEELIGEVHDEFDLPQAWSLMDLLPPSAVAVQLLAASPREAIAQLTARLAAAEPTLSEAEAFETVWERERKFSSAVGKGVAVPHGRLPHLSRPLVALGRFSKPVPFRAPDGVPVRLVFVILTPASSPVVQLKVLGRIAALVTNENLRKRLLRAKSADSLLETLRTADTMLAS